MARGGGYVLLHVSCVLTRMSKAGCCIAWLLLRREAAADREDSHLQILHLSEEGLHEFKECELVCLHPLAVNIAGRQVGGEGSAKVRLRGVLYHRLESDQIRQRLRNRLHEDYVTQFLVVPKVTVLDEVGEIVDLIRHLLRQQEARGARALMLSPDALEFEVGVSLQSELDLLYVLPVRFWGVIEVFHTHVSFERAFVHGQRRQYL